MRKNGNALTMKVGKHWMKQAHFEAGILSIGHTGYIDNATTAQLARAIASPLRAFLLTTGTLCSGYLTSPGRTQSFERL
jgi:hypothetical protein